MECNTGNYQEGEVISKLQRTTIFDVIEDEKERQKAFNRVKTYRQEIITALSVEREFGEDEVIDMILRCYKTTDLTPTEAIFLAWTVCKYMYYSGRYKVL